MKNAKAAFHVFGVPVFLPTSSLVGLGIMAWIALPASTSALGTNSNSFGILLLALLHGLLIYSVIFVHEFGHMLVAKRFGHQDLSIVLHLIGGHTSMRSKFKTPKEQFSISIAGPIFTLVLAVIGFFFINNQSPVIQSLSAWLLWTSIVGSVVNLLPGTPLDGGVIFSAVVWKITGSEFKGMRFAAYGGFVVAAIWAATPWLLANWLGFSLDTFDVFISGFIGVWLAGQAYNSLALSRYLEKQKLKPEVIELHNNSDVQPDLKESDWHLNIRKAVGVELQTSISEAIEMASAAKAGAIVAMRDDVPVGIVRDSLVSQMSEQQLQNSTVASISRLLGEHDVIAFDIGYRDFQERLSDITANEWLVIDEMERIVGVALRVDQI